MPPTTLAPNLLMVFAKRSYDLPRVIISSKAITLRQGIHVRRSYSAVQYKNYLPKKEIRKLYFFLPHYKRKEFKLIANHQDAAVIRRNSVVVPS